MSMRPQGHGCLCAFVQHCAKLWYKQNFTAKSDRQLQRSLMICATMPNANFLVKYCKAKGLRASRPQAKTLPQKIKRTLYGEPFDTMLLWCDKGCSGNQKRHEYYENHTDITKTWENEKTETHSGCQRRQFFSFFSCTAGAAFSATKVLQQKRKRLKFSVNAMIYILNEVSFALSRASILCWREVFKIFKRCRNW